MESPEKDEWKEITINGKHDKVTKLFVNMYVMSSDGHQIDTTLKWTTVSAFDTY